MSGAAQRTMETPELLEAILLQLPPQSLLLLQRVNKTFKASIDGSINLQRHLFFKQRPLRTSGELRLNPFIPIILKHHGLGGYMHIRSPQRWLKMSPEMFETHLAQANYGITLSIKHSRFDDVQYTLRSGSYNKMFVAESPTSAGIKIYVLRTYTKWNGFVASSLGEILDGLHSLEDKWEHEEGLERKLLEQVIEETPEKPEEQPGGAEDAVSSDTSGHLMK